MNIPSGKSAAPGKQQGMAALLVILLTGLSLSALTVGVMNYVSTAQDSGVSVHARTQAEINAWAGVEAWKLYLEGKDAAALPAGAQIKDAGGNTIATVEKVAGCPSSEFCYKMVGRSADSTALLEVAFGSTASTTPPKGKANIAYFEGNLEASGELLDILGNDKVAELVVSGDAVIGGVRGNSRVCVKQNLTINGGGSMGGTYRAMGDIWFTGQATANNLTLQGRNVTAGMNTGTLTAGGGSYALLEAQNDLAVGAGTIAKLNAANLFYVSDPSPTFVSGKIRNASVYDLKGLSPAQCIKSSGWPVLHCQSHAGLRLPPSSLLVDSTLVVPPVQCEAQSSKVDVNNLESLANYVFYKEHGKFRLKVQNVRINGVDVSGDWDVSNGVPTTFRGLNSNFPAVRLMDCWGGSCQVKPQSHKSSLSGIALAPGVLLFRGSSSGDSPHQWDITMSFPGRGYHHGAIMVAGDLELRGEYLGASDYQSTIPHVTAANFPLQAGGNGNICTQNASTGFELTQLCDGSNLKSYQDAGVSRRGIPLGNYSVLTNRNLLRNSLYLRGHVHIGGRMTVAGSYNVLEGLMQVGTHQDHAHQGAVLGNTGFKLDISKLTDDQMVTLGGGSGQGSGSDGSNGSAGNGVIRSPIILRSRPL